MEAVISWRQLWRHSQGQMEVLLWGQSQKHLEAIGGSAVGTVGGSPEALLEAQSEAVSPRCPNQVLTVPGVNLFTTECVDISYRRSSIRRYRCQF